MVSHDEGELPLFAPLSIIAMRGEMAARRAGLLLWYEP